MPFSHAELAAVGRASSDPATAIWTGGYPPLHDRQVEPDRWLGDYLATYLERDVRNVLAVRDLTRFSAFVRLCATRVGQAVNLAAMAGELGIDAKTAHGWLSVLVAGYIVHLLPPHHADLGKRVVKHPKLYLLDTGLACRLLGIGAPGDLKRHPGWGALVENWVVVETIKARRNRGQRCDTLYWWRSHDGLEVDLILDQGGRLRSAKIKATATPGPGDLVAQRRFAALAPERHGDGTLFHLGTDHAPIHDIHLAPWTMVDQTWPVGGPDTRPP